uniref:Transmembrane protein n=1 Tax=Heterorhabditis bacteriophora TaxID=37862 RepID=A0A1I7W6L9_HETBA
MENLAKKTSQSTRDVGLSKGIKRTTIKILFVVVILYLVLLIKYNYKSIFSNLLSPLYPLVCCFSIVINIECTISVLWLLVLSSSSSFICLFNSSRYKVLANYSASSDSHIILKMEVNILKTENGGIILNYVDKHVCSSDAFFSPLPNILSTLYYLYNSDYYLLDVAEPMVFRYELNRVHSKEMRRIVTMSRKMNYRAISSKGHIVNDWLTQGVIEKNGRIIRQSFMSLSSASYCSSTTRQQKQRKKSLNELLYRGLLMLPSLVGMLLHFREYKIAISGDIEKSFLQLGLNEKDRDILLRKQI